MNFKLEKINEKARMLVTIEGDVWKKALRKAENKQMETITVPGFRKGKAPQELIRKHLSQEKVTTDAINSISDEAYRFAMGQEEVLKLKMLNAPQLSVKEITEDKVVLEFIAETLPEVKLGDYKAIKVKPEEVTVTEEDVESVLTEISKQFSAQTPKDGAIAKNDIAIFDFEGFKDNVPFDGGKAENYELKIGSGQFIPGFEEQMIGMKAGESRDINVSFPENYHAKNLAGAPVVFKVKLHSIKTLKEDRSDETAKKVGIPNVDTWEALVSRVKEDIKQQKELNSKQKAEVQIMEQIVDSLEMNIPESMLEQEKQNLFQQFEMQLKQQQIEMSKYLENSGLTKEAILSDLEKDAIARLKTSFALSEIAKIEGIQVQANEIEEHYSQLAAQYGMEIEAVKKAISPDSLNFRLQNQKTVEFLYENATK